MAKKSKNLQEKSEDSKDKPVSATKVKGQMWYRFYIEPYFNDDDIKTLKDCISGDWLDEKAKDKKGRKENTIKKQLIDNKQIQAHYFPILLPFLLSVSKFDVFVQNYLNIGLQHRRNFSNSQNMIRANITQLDILAGGGGG